METQIIAIEKIKLFWSDWYRWKDIDTTSKSTHKVDIPRKKSGIYEVRYQDQDLRLTLGKSNNLEKRIRKGLVRGKLEHSAGKKIRSCEDLTQLVIRWAETTRPAAVEEDLHQKHFLSFGQLPIHVEKT